MIIIILYCDSDLEESDLTASSENSSANTDEDSIYSDCYSASEDQPETGIIMLFMLHNLS